MPDDRAAPVVLLLTQGTYPFAGGGVSTWCDLLCRGLPAISFDLCALTESVPAAARTALAPNVRRLMQIGQQGRPDAPHWLYGFAAAQAPPRRVARGGELERELVPPLRGLLESLARDQAGAEAAESVGETMVELWRLFHVLDWGDCWRSGALRQAFAEEAARLWSGGWNGTIVAPGPNRHDLAAALNWLRRFLAPLHSPLPTADLVHSSSAAGPSVALAVVAKRERGIPFLLTEHGIGVREGYIRRTAGGPFVQRFVAAMSRSWARAGYHHADAIATPSEFNRAWQIELGADPRKISVVPNGVAVDPVGAAAQPPSSPARSRDRRALTVVAVAGVKPIKDIETLIRAAALVRDQLPDVCFLVHGTLDDRRYVERCETLIHDLGLRAAFELRGFSDDRDAIYRAGDVAVLSSVSEGHPFALLEAMAQGLPVVATRVGGVPELVGDAGLLVPPRCPEELATALLELLGDPQRRAELGGAGREAVATRYTIERMLAAYGELYSNLATMSSGPARRAGEWRDRS